MLAARNKLPRKLALKRRLEIAALFENGKRFSGGYCTLVWQPDTVFKYGVFVPKKLGNAVTRNRVKRLIREAVRLHRHELATSGRLGIIPRNHGRIPTWKEIDSEVSCLIGKISA